MAAYAASAASAALAAITNAAQFGPAANQDQPDMYTATQTASVYAAQATAPTYEAGNLYHPGRVFDRYVEIWLENTDYDKAAGDPNLAWLAKQGITLSNYFGVTHPSEPNYVAAIGGDNFGMDNDKFNQVPDNTSTVIDLLEERGISWGSYQEDMPYTGFEGYAWTNQKTGANDYVRKHNPPVIYNANTSPRRLSYQKNLTQFYDDLEAKRLPQWMFITPNMTSDGHDTSVTVAGTWSRNFLEPLLSNPYFMERTLVLLTFDENHTYSLANRVFSILLGGAVPESQHGTTDCQYYNHYSDISTVEANWGLHTLGRWDVGANVFKLVADETGDIYRPSDEVAGSTPSQFLNASFQGPFNTQKTVGYAPWPVPNVFAVSPRTLRTVSPSIIAKYAGQQNSQQMYYNDSQIIPDGCHPPKGYVGNC
ncbi:related to acid phosphatase Pho610 [Lecanosticta acicola]|uniref:Related to acid phosphatase Pho610 n=1 Tax=Lecanosticta acicola TaxID=111012 RepID=A0AAI8Z9P2_9PEZI|nr:related to acid phosphatase Pho610 [Lecanosticta acicola]